MGIGRSTFYDTPDARARDLTIVAEMKTICDEFEAYGYRRVDAELRHRGIVVNAKKIRRLMHEHALNPKQRRRFVATTDSDHNYPIFPNLAKNMKLDGPNQLWVADITYVTIATGFVYLAAILDAWSRRVVGYAIAARSMHGSLLLHSRPLSAPAIHHGVACIIPTVDRNTPPMTIAPSCKSTVSPALWVGAETPTTTPRPRAL